MKRLAILIILFSILSCERESTITPISESQDIMNKINKTYTIRYPLLPEDVGQYSYGDVIEMDPEKKNLLQHITKPFKEILYGFVGVKLLKRNKIKAQAKFDVPREVFQYIKSVRIKRIFFVLDTCIDKSSRCSNTVDGNVKTSFIKNLFVNLEPLKSGTDIEDFKEISEDTFLDEAQRFIQNFKRKRGWQKSDTFEISKFSEKSNDRSRLKNLYIFKQKENLNRIENYLERSPYVKSNTRFGDLLLTETHPSGNYSITGMMYHHDFIREFKDSYKSIKPTSCSVGNCTELEVNSDNLITYLKRNPEVVINTFIKIGKLPKKDFNYKGFIEFDVELKI